VLERAKAVAEAVLLRRVASFALEASQALVELVHLGSARDHGPGVDGARDRLLGQHPLAARQVGASGGELGLRASERLFRLVKRGEPFLDVLEPFLGRLGSRGRAAGKIGLHFHERALSRFQLALTAIEVLSVRRETDLCMLECAIVRARATARASGSTDGIRELALACLDGRDALGQLAT
jgi:hypothetical protein